MMALLLWTFISPLVREMKPFYKGSKEGARKGNE
jgi:hypothetical protein